MRSAVVLCVVVLACVTALEAAMPERKALYEWVRHPTAWKDLGRANPDKVHKLTIALPPANRAVLLQAFDEISNPDHPRYRKFLTTEQVAELVDPGMEVKGPVLLWLHSVPNVHVMTHGDFIKVEAPIRAIETLFETEMHEFAHPLTGKTVVRHAGKTTLPTGVHRHVKLIEGLHEFPPLRPHLAQNFRMGDAPQLPESLQQVGNNTPTFYSVNFPLSWWAMYNISNGTNYVTAKGASQGMFAQLAADGIPVRADLRQFDLLNGIPVQTYTYHGENDTNLGGEASLDMQMMTSVAINASTTFFMQLNWMYTWVTDMIAMGDAAPLVASVSYGWNENQECQGLLHDIKICKSHGWNSSDYINATDFQFAKFGVTGHTLLASSGDQGAPGDENVGCALDAELALYPQYPCASAYITAVGATAVAGAKVADIGPVPHRGALSLPCATKLLNCTKGPQTEVACYTDVCDFTTGGGFSQLTKLPAWQQAAVDAYLKSGVKLPPDTKFNANGRAYPDVSAVGQNIMTIQSGDWYITGGTSASSPLLAGVMTLMNNWLLKNGKAPLGFVNPLLYKMAAVAPQTFNKVTWGNNYCTEEACCKYGFVVPSDGSFNPVTGLGTPNVGEWLQYIQQNLH